MTIHSTNKLLTYIELSADQLMLHSVYCDVSRRVILRHCRLVVW